MCGSLYLLHDRLGMFEVDLGCTRGMGKRNEHFLAALGITHGYVRHGAATLTNTVLVCESWPIESKLYFLRTLGCERFFSYWKFGYE